MVIGSKIEPNKGKAKGKALFIVKETIYRMDFDDYYDASSYLNWTDSDLCACSECPISKPDKFFAE